MKHWAANKANLGAPIVYTRASYTAVLFVDRNDDYTAFCSYTGTTQGTDSYDSNDEPAIPSDAAPSADGIQDPQVEGRRNCELSKGLFRGIPNLGTTYGFAGANVASVTFHFVHEPSIDALVKRGFYIASWPYREWFDYVTVQTKTGTNITVRTKSPLPSKLACHPGTIVLGST